MTLDHINEKQKMGRKANLINEYRRVLKTCKKGSFSSKKRYYTVMQSIISDLIALNSAPRTLSHLSNDNLKSLVDYWKQQKNRSEAIINKLSVLRRYCKIAGISVELLSNKDLKLTRTKHINPLQFDEKITEKIYHPITKSIIAFQIEFGLTKSESIKLMVNELTTKDQLIIYRDTAYNHRDRAIPIINESQRQIIKERLQLLNDKNNLTQIMPFNIIYGLYRAELYTLGAIHPGAFRKYYALKRFSVLTKEVDQTKAYCQLQTELGFISIYTLRKWLHE